MDIGRATTRANTVQVKSADGRPQGPTPPHPHRPRPYYTPISVAPCFGGAGVHPCLFERYCPQGDPLLPALPLSLRDRWPSAFCLATYLPLKAGGRPARKKGERIVS